MAPYKLAVVWILIALCAHTDVVLAQCSNYDSNPSSCEGDSSCRYDYSFSNCFEKCSSLYTVPVNCDADSSCQWDGSNCTEACSTWSSFYHQSDCEDASLCYWSQDDTACYTSCNDQACCSALDSCPATPGGGCYVPPFNGDDHACFYYGDSECPLKTDQTNCETDTNCRWVLKEQGGFVDHTISSCDDGTGFLGVACRKGACVQTNVPANMVELRTFYTYADGRAACELLRHRAFLCTAHIGATLPWSYDGTQTCIAAITGETPCTELYAKGECDPGPCFWAPNPDVDISKVDHPDRATCHVETTFDDNNDPIRTAYLTGRCRTRSIDPDICSSMACGAISTEKCNSAQQLYDYGVDCCEVRSSIESERNQQDSTDLCVPKGTILKVQNTIRLLEEDESSITLQVHRSVPAMTLELRHSCQNSSVSVLKVANCSLLNGEALLTCRQGGQFYYNAQKEEGNSQSMPAVVAFIEVPAIDFTSSETTVSLTYHGLWTDGHTQSNQEIKGQHKETPTPTPPHTGYKEWHLPVISQYIDHQFLLPDDVTQRNSDLNCKLYSIVTVTDTEDVDLFLSAGIRDSGKGEQSESVENFNVFETEMVLEEDDKPGVYLAAQDPAGRIPYIKDTDTYNEVKFLTFLGPARIREGGSFSWGVFLSSQPTDIVELTISLQNGADLPAETNIGFGASDLQGLLQDEIVLVFTTSNWYEPQLVNLAFQNDNYDSTFSGAWIVRHENVESGDKVYSPSSKNVAGVDFERNAEVYVYFEDDDAAGLSLNTDEAVLMVGQDTLIRVNLTSTPLESVTIQVTSNANFKVSSSSSCVLETTASDLSCPFTVSATSCGGNSATFQVISQSDDDNYDQMKNEISLSMESCAENGETQILVRQKGSSEESGQSVNFQVGAIREGQSAELVYKLDVASDNSTVLNVVNLEHMEQNDERCNFTFTPSNTTGEWISFAVSADDDYFASSDEDIATCTFTLSMSTASTTITLQILEDDVRDMKLILIEDVEQDKVCSSQSTSSGSGASCFKQMSLCMSETPGSVVEESYGVAVDSQPPNGEFFIVHLDLNPPRQYSPANVSISPPRMIFSHSNWTEIQTVRIILHDDEIENQKLTETWTINHTMYSSSGALLTDVEFLVVRARIRDEDEAGIEIIDHPSLMEEGDTQTYKVALTSKPYCEGTIGDCSITVQAYASLGNALEIDPGTLQFSSQNWSEPCNISIKTLSGDWVGTTRLDILHNISNADDPVLLGRWNKFAISVLAEAPSQEILIRRKGTNGKGQSGLFQVGSVAEGQTEMLQYKFNASSLSTVLLEADGNNDERCESTLPNTRVAASGWIDFSVGVKDDYFASNDDNEVTCEYTLSTAATATLVLGTTIKLQIVEDDVRDMKLILREDVEQGKACSSRSGSGGVGASCFKKMSLCMSEVDGSEVKESYGVAVDSQPQEGEYFIVTLKLNPPRKYSPANVSISPPRMIFSHSNWSQIQTARIALHDDDVENASPAETWTINHTMMHSSKSESGAIMTDTDIESLTVIVRVSDNDEAGIDIVQKPSPSVTEGESDTYKVALRSKPHCESRAGDCTASVTIQVKKNGNIGTVDNIQVHPRTLKFSSQNWSTPQNVFVESIHDKDTEENVVFDIVHNISDANDHVMVGRKESFAISVQDIDRKRASIEEVYTVGWDSSEQQNCTWNTCSTHGLCMNITLEVEYKDLAMASQLKYKCRDSTCEGTVNNLAQYSVAGTNRFSFRANILDVSIVCHTVDFDLDASGKWKKEKWLTTKSCGEEKYLDYYKIEKSSIEVKNLASWECSDCRSGAVCRQGFIAGTKPGYWFLPLDTSRMQSSTVEGTFRSSHYLSHKEDWAVPCIDPASCLGFEDDLQNSNHSKYGKCAPGSSGVLCAVCDENYSRSYSRCRRCTAIQITAMISVVAVFLLAVGLLVRIFRRKLSKYRSAWRDIVRLGKIQVDFMQVNSSMPSILDKIDWPREVLEWLSRLSFVDFDLLSFLGVTCASSIGFIEKFWATFCLVILAFLWGVMQYCVKYCSIRKVSKLSNEKRRQVLAEVFSEVDDDESGGISADELRAALASMGFKVSKTAANAAVLMTGLDGEISLETFIKVMENGQLLKILKDDDSEEDAAQVVPRKLARRKTWRKKSNMSLDFMVNWTLKKRLISSSFSASAQLIILIHTAVTRKTFQFFNCAKVGELYYLKADFSIQCYSSQYRALLPGVLAVLVCFVISLPLILALYFFVRKEQLHHHSVRDKVGFLYDRFVRGAEFWEVHEMVRKAMLTGVLILIEDKFVQAAVAVLVCLTACSTINYFQPHKNRVVFFGAQMAFIACALKYLGVVVLMGDLSSADRSQAGYLLVSVDVLTMFFGVGSMLAIISALRKSTKLSMGGPSKSIKAETDAASGKKQEFPGSAVVPVMSEPPTPIPQPTGSIKEPPTPIPQPTRSIKEPEKGPSKLDATPDMNKATDALPGPPSKSDATPEMSKPAAALPGPPSKSDATPEMNKPTAALPGRHL